MSVVERTHNRYHQHRTPRAMYYRERLISDLAMLAGAIPQAPNSAATATRWYDEICALRSLLPYRRWLLVTALADVAIRTPAVELPVPTARVGLAMLWTHNETTEVLLDLIRAGFVAPLAERRPIRTPRRLYGRPNRTTMAPSYRLWFPADPRPEPPTWLRLLDDDRMPKPATDKTVGAAR